jgi:amino acid adenylation domain-containing protein
MAFVRSIQEAVLEQARATPEAPALRFKDRSYSYRAVVGSALAFARELLRERPSGNGPVAVLAAKSPEAVAGFLGALFAGAAYLPLDTRSPRARLQAILDRAAPRGLFHGAAHAGLARELAGAGLACAPLPEIAEDADLSLPAAPVAAGDLAYLLFTSGSTGEPKGVPISHGNAAAFVDWAAERFDLDAQDRVAVHAPLHFDLPVFDLYVGLRKGACLLLIPDEVVLFPEATSRLLAGEGATVLYAVPSALLAILKRGLEVRPLGPLRTLLYAGEEFPAAHLERLRRAVPGARIFNLYGPVETNVVTCFELDDRPFERVPIGRAVAGAEIALLLDDGAVSAHGPRQGEIIVHGPSVFAGYWGGAGPDRMWTDPAGKVWYRTGDLGYWREDGDLQFVGRRDSMIKTRGFRVELGEVEAVLHRHPEVAQAAVVARPDPDLTHTLHAFVVPAAGAALGEAALLRWCREHLPGYMVPAGIRVLRELPTGRSGKVDRLRLAEGLETPLDR